MIRIRHAVLGALALAGSQVALAIPPGATLDGIVGTQFEFYIGGSSAIDNDISKTLSGSLCADAMDTYQDGATTDAVKGGFWKAYTCTLKAAGAYTIGSATVTIPASLGGAAIIVHKRQKEGSLYGSVPVSLGGYVEFMDLASTRASGTCVADGANTYDCVVSPVVANRDVPRHTQVGETSNADECDYNSVALTNPLASTDKTKDTLCRRTTLGLSDTEAEMFLGANTNPRPNASDTANVDDFPSGGLSALQLRSTKLTRKRVVGQVFGVLVSDNVYTALQNAQGITVNVGSQDANANADNWPSLSSDQIRQLMSGTVSQWTQVVGNIGLAGAVNDIAICRRDQGSGTQATINAYFFNYPCDTQNGTPQRDTGGLGVTAGSPVDPGLTGAGVLYVAENFSGTVLKNCMNAAAAGTLPGTTLGSTKKYGAIGIINVNGAASGSWKYVKVDGVAPLLKNAILGKYDLWTEVQVAYNPGSGTTKESAVETDFVNMIESPLGQPGVISSATVNDQGLAALSYNGFTWDDGTNNSDAVTTTNDFKVTNPVMGGVHGGVGAAFPASGTSPLSCRKIRNAVDDPTTQPNRSM